MVIVSWYAARFSAPCAVATTTVERIATRRDRVRSMSHEPTVRCPRIPPQLVRTATPSTRNRRPSITR